MSTQDQTDFFVSQDLDASLDYSLDWTEFAGTDSIVQSDWTSDDGVVLNSKTLKDGVATVFVTFVSPAVAGRSYSFTNSVVTSSSPPRRDQRTIHVLVTDEHSSLNKTALFPSVTSVISGLRRDRLMLAMQSVLPGVDLSDSYIAEKIRAAEADAEHTLRVFFEPVTVFAYEPTDAEIAALNGTRYVEESPYDYEPSLWSSEDWGYLALRKSPVSKIEYCAFFYPAVSQAVMTLPLDWIRLDKKAGHIRFVPSGSAMSIAPLSGFIMSALSGGRQIPDMIRLRYKAGLANAASEYPELVDMVKKMAVLRIVEDAFLPTSGSISADGLSQSVSVDVSKYHDGVDKMMSKLQDVIHGIRMMVL